MGQQLHKFESSSDYFFKSIPLIYPKGFTVVINDWFRGRNLYVNDFWDKEFSEWSEKRLKNSKLSQNHPFGKMVKLQMKTLEEK